MSRKRCSVFGCQETASFHRLPKYIDIRDQWLMFIYSEIPQQYSSNLTVCSAHFTSDCFTNQAQFNAGFAQKLLIKDTAVPTLLGTAVNPKPGTSQDSQLAIRTKHVGTQTDPPRSTTVGTQLSIGTLREHVRSKGTQTVSFTGELQRSSTSVKGDKSGVQGSRPAKRPRIKEEEEEEYITFEIPEHLDFTYKPEHSIVTESSKIIPTSTCGYNEAKYIVYGSCLLELFENCPVCQQVCDVTPLRRGTFLAIDQLCPHCQYSRKWKSQPVIGSNPAGNLQLSAAIYFNGASFFQLEKIFEAMHIELFKYNTFRRHARMFLEPTIFHKWRKDQETLMHQLSQEDKVIIGGHMRADSPGHSAKYGSYSVMHLEKKQIIDIQLVQSNEVDDSYHMELEGLKRSLESLAASGIVLDYIVTDRHPQVQKYLRDNNIKNFYETWHLENDPPFPKCEHPDKTTTDPSKWLQPGSKSLYKVEKAFLNKRVLKDVEKLSPNHQTFSLEAFHRVILRFAPKNVVLPFLGMLCRLYLSAMHFNENADRPQATTSTGKPVFKIKFPKAKGLCTAKPVKTGPTYSYIQELMEILFENVFEDPGPYLMEVENIKIPDPLSSQYDRPPKDGWLCQL